MKCNPDEQYHRRYFFYFLIHFECRRCGACCTGDPGIIRISGQEIKVLAEFLKMPVPDLTRIHLRPIATGFSIAEEADGTCRFYDQGCRIYPVRPFQCRIYPFWFSQMRSLRQWEKARCQCPGIGNGILYSRERILDMLSQSMDQLESMEDQPPADRK
ncbi:MAG: YkgJ family cysteine cluster protein [Deltaproteobacteria bacterium]|nr:YkgJ family cysteine cluster protein [Deltaproteobacteria bacterium]